MSARGLRKLMGISLFLLLFKRMLMFTPRSYQHLGHSGGFVCYIFPDVRLEHQFKVFAPCVGS